MITKDSLRYFGESMGNLGSTIYNALRQSKLDEASRKQSALDQYWQNRLNESSINEKDAMTGWYNQRFRGGAKPSTKTPTDPSQMTAAQYQIALQKALIDETNYGNPKNPQLPWTKALIAYQNTPDGMKKLSGNPINVKSPQITTPNGADGLPPPPVVEDQQ